MLRTLLLSISLSIIVIAAIGLAASIEMNDGAGPRSGRVQPTIILPTPTPTPTPAPAQAGAEATPETAPAPVGAARPPSAQASATPPEEDAATPPPSATEDAAVDVDATPQSMSTPEIIAPSVSTEQLRNLP